MLQTLNPQTNLTTQRLLLREITLSDAPEMFRLRSDEQIMKYIGRPRAKRIEDAEELITRISQNIERNTSRNWGITMQGNDKIIGSIGFVTIIPEHFRAELGYLLDPHFQRQGIMHEAIQAVLHYGFAEMNLHSVEAITAPENEASNNILLKSGFILEGHFKEDFYFDGKFLDSNVFSLLKSNFSVVI
ncbi:MAG: GNAT family N-acetyltransferase [Bacteroidetes bacterium]|nr:GNAT family N-acetyltransferase [Bacteroidota bacterium]